MKRISTLVTLVAAVWGLVFLLAPIAVRAGGGSGGSGASGGGGNTGSTIKVSKCFYVAGNSTMLVNASSSNSSAHLTMYSLSGSYIGEVQNGGGGRYGGTVFFVAVDPVFVTIVSSAGDSITVPTTPFVL